MSPSAEKKPLEGKNVVVIGTGIGGAAVSALLASQGAKPVVIERSAIVGGKAGAYDRRGCKMEVGIHIAPRGKKGPLGEIAKLTGANIDFVDMSPVVRLIYGENERKLPQKLASVKSAFNIISTIKPAFSEYGGLMRFSWLVWKSKSLDEASSYYGMSAHKLLTRYFTDPDMHAFMNYCSSIMFVMSTSEVSAAQFLVGLNNWFSDGATAYPKGGYGAIPQAYLDVCEQSGGSLKLKEKAEEIVVDDGKVVGVKTNKGFYPADIVVSNAGILKTVDLCGEGVFPEQYASKIRQLKDSHGAVVVKYALKKKLTSTPITIYIPKRFDLEGFTSSVQNKVVPDDGPLYIISPTVVDPDLAPEGQHILMACTGAPADMFDKDVNKKLLDLVEERMEALHPGLQENTLWKQRHGIDYFAAVGGRGFGEAIGLAQTYEQDGQRFSPRTPVNGLYVVGADTGAYGIGTELAALSSLTARDMILDDLGAK